MATTRDRPDSPLRDLRLARELRLVDVAAAAGISVGMVSMIEHGYVPKPKTREKLARALGVGVGELWP